jgi:hypothetical protein
LGSEGKLTSDVVLPALTSQLEKLREEADSMPATINDAFTNLRSQLMVTVGSFYDATGASSGLVGSIDWIRVTLEEATPEILNFGRALTGALDPTDELSDGTKIFASVLVTLYGVLKSVGQLLTGTVLLAFKTVGKVIGGVAAAVIAALSGDFKGAFEIVKEASSDISTTWAADSATMAQDAIDTTSDMFTKLDQIWNKGARQIQDRSSSIVTPIDDTRKDIKVPGPTAEQLAKQQRELDKVRNALTGVLNQIDPLAGAQLELAKAEETLDKARQKGLITSDQQAQYGELLKTYYRDILDPLGAYNRELELEAQLLGMSAKEREIESQMLAASQDLLAKGVVLTTAETEALRGKLTALQELAIATQTQDQLLANSVGQREAYVQQLEAINALLANPESGFTKGDAGAAVADQVAAMGLDPTFLQANIDAIMGQQETMYANIKLLRDNNLISEQEAAALRAQAWVQSQQTQLQAASGFFGDLAQLQKSESSKMAKIGKAAAIAQTVINTYQAAMSAYASLASIPYVGPALGAAAAGAAIAMGMQNVAQIRKQPVGGYMLGGYTGDISASSVAGLVHGREYVMDAGSTRQIGRENLDALRSGDAVVAMRGQAQSEGATAGGGATLNVSIENHGTSKEFDVQQLGPNDVRIIARDEITKRVPELVATEMDNPNSRVSKAMGRNTGAGRRR